MHFIWTYAHYQLPKDIGLFCILFCSSLFSALRRQPFKRKSLNRASSSHLDTYMCFSCLWQCMWYICARLGHVLLSIFQGCNSIPSLGSLLSSLTQSFSNTLPTIVTLVLLGRLPFAQMFFRCLSKPFLFLGSNTNITGVHQTLVLIWKNFFNTM